MNKRFGLTTAALVLNLVASGASLAAEMGPDAAIGTAQVVTA